MENQNAHLAEFTKTNPKSMVRTSISHFGENTFLVMFVKFHDATNSYYKPSKVVKGTLEDALKIATAGMPRGSVQVK
jgi:hypothetical protein